MNLAIRQPGLAGEASVPGGVMAGLVPFKTSSFLSGVLISFAPSSVADRRVKRLKRSVWASGHLHGLADKGFRPPVCWFVTLTYRGIDDWRSEHMAKTAERFRNWCHSVGVPCRYTWVAELQSRGAVHYHLLAWLPQGVRMPHWDRPVGRRKAFWSHGMTNTQVAKSGVGYLMKYLSKLSERTRFPKGLRLYGIAGLTTEGRAVRSWLNLPAWAKASFGVGELCRAARGLVVRVSGEILEPAYSVAFVPSGLLLSKRRDVPERWFDGAYSTFPRAGVPC
jgi:hypothetical protein